MRVLYKLNALDMLIRSHKVHRKQQQNLHNSPNCVEVRCPKINSFAMRTIFPGTNLFSNLQHQLAAISIKTACKREALC